jgi:hypothetical protein
MSVTEHPIETARLQSLLSVFLLIDNVRRSLGLDAEEALLYLAIGYLNTERIQQIGSQGYISSTNVSSVADFVNLPKETARRKIARLAEHGLVLNNGGIVVSNVTRWFGFIEQLPTRG